MKICKPNEVEEVGKQRSDPSDTDSEEERRTEETEIKSTRDEKPKEETRDVRENATKPIAHPQRSRLPPTYYGM